MLSIIRDNDNADGYCTYVWELFAVASFRILGVRGKLQQQQQQRASATVVRDGTLPHPAAYDNTIPFKRKFILLKWLWFSKKRWKCLGVTRNASGVYVPRVVCRYCYYMNNLVRVFSGPFANRHNTERDVVYFLFYFCLSC